MILIFLIKFYSNKIQFLNKYTFTFSRYTFINLREVENIFDFNPHYKCKTEENNFSLIKNNE